MYRNRVVFKYKFRVQVEYSPTVHDYVESFYFSTALTLYYYLVLSKMFDF